MHYSYKNTLCGLAVLVAAGLLADYANAQTVTLEEEEAVVSLEKDAEMAAPEEISLFDEQEETDISLKENSEDIKSVSTDVIPMEGSTDDKADQDISLSIEDAESSMQNPVIVPGESSAKVAPEATKVVSDTAPVVTGKLLGEKSSGGFDEAISPSINEELFSRMSELEKETALLNLELKRERVQNEIAAVKAQRQKAYEEEAKKRAEEERKRQEWENEQARLMVAEQTKLKEAEAALESLRQEKIVKAYKETMLGDIQKWIGINAEAYKLVSQKEAEIKNILDQNAEQMSYIKQKASDIKKKANAAKVAYDKKVANLESQISILKARLESEIENSKKKIAEAKAEGRSTTRNPFATSAGLGTSSILAPEKIKLSDEYAIMEITGQNEQMAAKLINIEGDLFMVRVGTTLRNGYTIDEITRTYVSAVKEDKKDVLYFSAGGVLDQEPLPSSVTPKTSASGNSSSATSSESNAPKGRRLNATRGIPSLGQGMFIR